MPFPGNLGPEWHGQIAIKEAEYVPPPPGGEVPVINTFPTSLRWDMQPDNVLQKMKNIWKEPAQVTLARYPPPPPTRFNRNEYNPLLTKPRFPRRATEGRTPFLRGPQSAAAIRAAKNRRRKIKERDIRDAEVDAKIKTQQLADRVSRLAVARRAPARSADARREPAAKPLGVAWATSNPKPAPTTNVPAAVKYTHGEEVYFEDEDVIIVPTAGEVGQDQDTEDWTSYTLTTTKASLLKGMRHHIMRMHPRNYNQVLDLRNPGQTISVPRDVNILDPAEFKHPIRLRRRDPTGPLGGVKEAAVAAALASTMEPVYDEAYEARMQERAQKAADKAEVESKIAPDGRKKGVRFGKRTEQVFRYDQENATMRHEESLPWFVEDYDNSNTWQGQREQNMSNGRFVALVFDENGRGVKMVPMEKWYKFRELSKTKLSPEEAEAEAKRIKNQQALPSWVKKSGQKEEEKLTAEEQRLYFKNAKYRAKKVVTWKGAQEVSLDIEEVDYEEERFDDDDAGKVYGFEGDNEEERKAIEDRIKKEQTSAALSAYHYNDQSLFEVVGNKDSKATASTKQFVKKTKKALRNREKNHNYNSDSDQDPYASSSEDEDEIYRLAEQHKKELAAQEAAAAQEVQKLADAEERKRKATEQRREDASLKKAKKSHDNPTGNIPLPADLKPSGRGKKGGKNVVPTSTPMPPTADAYPCGKRRTAYISDSDSDSDTAQLPVFKNNNKRKLETKPAGILQIKKQKTLPAHIHITDADVRAILIANPQGVSIGTITNPLKSRIRPGTGDFKELVDIVKRVARRTKDKTFVLR